MVTYWREMSSINIACKTTQINSCINWMLLMKTMSNIHNKVQYPKK